MSYLMSNLSKLKFWIKFQKEVRFSLNRILWDSGSPDTKLEPTGLDAIFPGIRYSNASVEVRNFLTRERGESLELEELLSILTIVKQTRASNILEIGTFDGNTTLNMAANIPESGKVVTIDLPPDGLAEKLLSGRDQPVNFERRQFIGFNEESKITQIYGDSAKLDWQELGGPFDLVFIDADHSSHYVFQDTLNALNVLKRGGAIIWHDYEMKSVSSVLDSSIGKENLFWIKGTRLAFCTFEDPETSRGSFSLD